MSDQNRDNNQLENNQLGGLLGLVKGLRDAKEKEEPQSGPTFVSINKTDLKRNVDEEESDADAAEGYKSTFKSADTIEDLDEDLTAPKAEERKEPAFGMTVEEIMKDVKPASKCCVGTCAVRGGKMHVYDWLEDLPEPPGASDLVEVQFKNTRKAYYRNQSGVNLKKGDIVAVESSPGHDIGEVTLCGRLVYLQMHKYHINPKTYEFKKVYRIARQTDLDKWEEAKALEQSTMLESRTIAEQLKLNMKIGDVEYQGDRTKAIFYYIADERVDFRELIKVLADRFKVRIEMKQIGARQEAGRIGGIGPCGRELCCATWMSNFVSVTTHSARLQDLSLNPVKLAGQCGKLKCCLNYELDVYLDAMQNFPPTDKPLETEEGTFYFFKYDIFKRLMWYSPQKDAPVNIVAVDADHVREVQAMNARGEKPKELGSSEKVQVSEDQGYNNVVEEGDLTRFDKKNKRGNRGGRDHDRNRGNRDRGQGMRGGDNRGERQRPQNQQNAAQANAGAEAQPQQGGEQGQQQSQQPQQQGNNHGHNNRGGYNNDNYRSKGGGRNSKNFNRNAGGRGTFNNNAGNNK